MTSAFNRLFLYAIRNRPPKELKRFPLDDRPQPWTVSLAEAEARDLAPLYLANVFSRRDIARANVHQVGMSTRVKCRNVGKSVPTSLNEFVERPLGLQVLAVNLHPYYHPMAVPHENIGLTAMSPVANLSSILIV